jgi:hypothetical protein
VILNLNIPVAWHHIRVVREAIKEELSGQSESTRRAAMMAGSELLENALKYGVRVPDMENITFMLEANQENIAIEVSNGVTDVSKIQDLQQNIERIAQANDKEALYLDRLRELLLNPNEYGKLGLYRIAFEGKFSMSFQYTAQILRVKAQRAGSHE